jgi:cell division protein FtsB
MEKSDSRFLRIRQELGFWTRTTKIIFVGVAAVCVFGVVFGDYGLMRVIELKKERAELEEEIIVWTRKQRLLEEWKYKLENDDFTIEEIARNRGGLYKPGETIFLFEDADSSENTGTGRIPLDKYSLNR